MNDSDQAMLNDWVGFSSSEPLPYVPPIRSTPVTARSRTAVLRSQLNAIAEELARLEARPEEPGPGTVIKFEMPFNGGVRYTYVAVNAGGGWYTSGKGPQRATWDRLLDWMAESNCTGFAVQTTSSFVELS